MSAPSTAAVNGSPLLALDNVTTYYGQMRILEGISLQVGAGELVCLRGGEFGPRRGEAGLDGGGGSAIVPFGEEFLRLLRVIKDGRQSVGQG